MMMMMMMITITMTILIMAVILVNVAAEAWIVEINRNQLFTNNARVMNSVKREENSFKIQQRQKTELLALRQVSI
jgi:hypothetical protein